MALQTLSNDDPVSFGACHGEFAHLPGFVGDGADAGGGLGGELLMIGGSIIHSEVGEIVVATEFAGVDVIGAFAEHDHAVVFLHEDPAGGFIDDLKAEDVDEEARGIGDAGDGEDVVVLEDGGHWGCWGRGCGLGISD